MRGRLTIPKPKTYAQYGMILLIIKVFLSYTAFGNMIPYADNLLSFSAVVCLGISILSKGYTIKRLIIYAAITLLGLYSSYCVGDVMIFTTILTIFAIYNEKRIIVYLYKYEVFFFVLLFVLSALTGNINRLSVDESSLNFNFGFTHPNVAAAMLFNMMIMWVWLSYDNLKWTAYFKLIIFSIVMHFITGSRTILFMGLATSLLVIISKSDKVWLQKGLKIIAGWTVPVLSLFFLYTTVNYQSGVVSIRVLDALMTGRLKLGAYAYEHYGFTLFGQAIMKGTVFGYDATWNMSRFSTFDNLYTKLMINNGMVWLLIIALAFFYISRLENNIINCMLIVWSFFAISEGHGLNVYLCFPILFIVLIIDKNKNLNMISEFS